MRFGTRNMNTFTATGAAAVATGVVIQAMLERGDEIQLQGWVEAARAEQKVNQKKERDERMGDVWKAVGASVVAAYLFFADGRRGQMLYLSDPKLREAAVAVYAGALGAAAGGLITLRDAKDMGFKTYDNLKQNAGAGFLAGAVTQHYVIPK
jgi:hypothetical protein